LSNNPERTPRAVIFGCAGLSLTAAEHDFFSRTNPAGFILFQRNCADPDQIRALTADLRACVGRQAPILIDQEGGRVQRLKPPLWRAAPPAAVFAALAERDIMVARRAVWVNARLIAADLAALGIDVDCAPVLDVPVPGAHDVIGDRAFGTRIEVIAELGRAMCDGLVAGGVLPVIKHIPGHGRAMADSHLACPVVTASAESLAKQDLPPFKALADMPFAMTAHVVYTAWDDRVATLSAKVIDTIIRDAIGFDGVLMSDDLSMKALGGSFADRTRDALAAGCDVVLHCNGSIEEMAEIAAAAPPLSARAAQRWDRALSRRQSPEAMDADVLLDELSRLIASGEGQGHE
jgi:beta-N-acetylhexosaminidase